MRFRRSICELAWVTLSVACGSATRAPADYSVGTSTGRMSDDSDGGARLPDCCPGSGGDPTPDPEPQPDVPVELDDTSCTDDLPGPRGFCYVSEEAVALPGRVHRLDFSGDGQTDYVSAREGLWSVQSENDGSLPYTRTLGLDLEVDAELVDVDLDGTLELIQLGPTELWIIDLLGASDPSTISIGKRIAGATLVDLDGAPPIDLAVVDADEDRIGLLEADGRGGYAPVQWLSTGANPLDIAAVDIDGDGGRDLVVAAANDDALAVRLRTDNGFGPTELIDVGLSPRALAVADFNGDGLEDIAVASYLSNEITVAITVPSSPPQLVVQPSAHFRPRQLQPLRHDDDDAIDLLVRAPDAEVVDVMGSLGDGELELRGSPTLDSLHRLAAFDLSGDARDEIVAVLTVDGARVLATDADGLTEVATLGTGDRGFVLGGDVDGDGTLDLVAAADDATYVLHDATAFRGPLARPEHAGISAIIGVTDVDGDGMDELLVVGGERARGELWVVDTVDGGLGTPVPIGETLTGSVVVDDINGDGVLDVLEVAGGGCSVILSNARGGFHDRVAVQAPCAQPRLVDFDGDATLDLVDLENGVLRIAIGDGSGQFATWLDQPVSADSLRGVGDVDGDGWPDVVTLEGCCRVGIHRSNNGTGLRPHFNLALPGEYAEAVALVDLDGDGASELVISRGGFHVVLDEGDHWVAYRLSATGTCEDPIGDVNGDGLVDFTHGNSDECISVRR